MNNVSLTQVFSGEWLEYIPTDWKQSKIKYLFSIKKNIVGELGHDVISITQRGARLKDTESGKGQLSMDYSKYQLVTEGDFLMNHMDLLTGYVDISKFNGVTSPDYRVFTVSNENAYPRYCLYLFQHGYKSKIFYAYGRGSSQLGRWRFPTVEFENFYFPIPPIEEQKLISRYLDKKTEQIDRLLGKIQKKIELLNEKKLKLIEGVLLNPNSKKIRIEHILNVVQRQVDVDEKKTYSKIGMLNWGRGIFKYPSVLGCDLGDSSFNYLKEGDLLLSGQFAWEGAVSIVGKSESNCIASHRFHIVNVNEDIILNEYLWSYLTSQEGNFLLNENSPGSAGRNRPLNFNKLKKWKIPVPEIDIQIEVQRLVNEINHYKKYAQHKTKLLKEYRQSLISFVVTGKLRVTKDML
jgi:type I restriction enzyme, S subunit